MLIAPPKPIAPPMPTLAPPATKIVAPYGQLRHKYTVNGIKYAVSKDDGKNFELFSVPFAKFDCTTGLCDRYVGMRMYDAPPDSDPNDLATLMLDCISLMRHGGEWCARAMFGPNGYHFGKTPLEAAQKAVAACKK